jgi:hypothetical protein
MRVSKYFTLEEFTASQYAERHNIVNKPDEVAIENIKKLSIQLLDSIRSYIGKPIFITSGYRCKELNSAIGGAKNSQHMKGQAADIVCPAIGNLQLFVKIMELWHSNMIEFDQLIWEFGTKTYPAWIHISYNEGDNRNDIIRALRFKNNTLYRFLDIKDLSEIYKLSEEMQNGTKEI